MIPYLSLKRFYYLQNTYDMYHITVRTVPLYIPVKKREVKFIASGLLDYLESDQKKKRPEYGTGHRAEF